MSPKDDEGAPDAPALALLSSVTSGLSMAREPRILRQRFEEQLRAIIQARSVAVRETPPDLACPAAVVSVDLPSAPWATPARLEASFDPAHTIDDWQRRTLSMGAHLASLLMQLEQATGRFGRPRAVDGAAPLIGSSPAIRSVRERIERVAATDFTVLIEGESGPEPHPSFVEVFGQASVDDGHWAVAGAALDAERMRHGVPADPLGKRLATLARRRQLEGEPASRLVRFNEPAARPVPPRSSPFHLSFTLVHGAFGSRRTSAQSPAYADRVQPRSAPSLDQVVRLRAPPGQHRGPEDRAAGSVASTRPDGSPLHAQERSSRCHRSPTGT